MTTSQFVSSHITSTQAYIGAIHDANLPIKLDFGLSQNMMVLHIDKAWALSINAESD